jgi:hypothetical protein
MKALLPKKVIEICNALKAERSNYEQLWQELADYGMPRKDDVVTQNTPGQKKYVNLLDSTMMTSNELLAATLHGLLTNPSSYFFALTTGNPLLDAYDTTRFWLQSTARKIHNVLNNSNFQTEVHELYLDECCFGFSPMQIEEDTELIVRFNTRPIREVYCKENSKGVIDTLYRIYKATAQDLMDDFGEKSLPKKVLDAQKESKPDKFEVIHALYPRSIVPDDKGSEKFKYVSQYILVSEKANLSVKGFYEFPYVVPRWTKAAGEVYGRGPGEKALPEAKTLNKMTETTLKGAQKVVDPPLQAPDDGFVMPLATKPGGLNYYRSGSEDRIEPIFADARIDFGYQAIEMKQRQVREAYYIDQLKLREGPQMTATEVMERTEQAMRFLAPMLGRQQFEFLQPLIERVYSIMERRGEIDDVPQELAGIPLKVQYISVVAMSQRLSEVQAVRRTMQDIAPFMSIDPNARDNFNCDNAIKGIAKLHNFPQEMLNTQNEIGSIREQRSKEIQAQQQVSQGMNEADQISKIATAASKVMPQQNMG